MVDSSMSGEATEGTEISKNGASSSSFNDAKEAARVSFLASAGADSIVADDEAAEKPAVEDPKDDDSDLDDEEAAVEQEADEEDEDKDLDEEEDKKEDGKPDGETAKRIDQVQRTDKRLREQREKDFASRDAEFQSRVAAVEKEWAPRIEKAERIERLLERAAIDPVALLQAANIPEDRYEHAAQVLYTLSKAKGGDEKARIAAAQLIRDRERDDEIARLKAKYEEREKAEAERAKTTDADRQVDAFIDTVTKATSDKTPLAKAYLKNDPSGAREELQIVAFRLAEQNGTLPSAKAVMIAFEKRQRAALRARGIDPKSRAAPAAVAASGDPRDKIDAAIKKGELADKKNGKKASPAKAEDKPLTKEDFISGNYD